MYVYSTADWAHRSRIISPELKTLEWWISGNAWSSLFDNLKINIILQDYLKSVWKMIKFILIFNHLRNCSSQSEKSGQPMREQKYSYWRKPNGYPRREKKSGLGQKWKVSTVDIRIKKSGLKFIHSIVPSSALSNLIRSLLTNLLLPYLFKLRISPDTLLSFKTDECFFYFDLKLMFMFRHELGILQFGMFPR